MAAGSAVFSSVVTLPFWDGKLRRLADQGLIALLISTAVLVAVLILRWVWERINIYSEITAIAASLVCAPVILFSVEAEWLRLLLMSSISTIAVITVTLLTRPTNKKTLVIS